MGKPVPIERKSWVEIRNFEIMLKKIYISSVLLICCYLHPAAQSKGDYQWIFGSNAEPLEGSEGSLLIGMRSCELLG